MSAEQPDGSYPRLNGSLLQSCQYAGMIVSLVGKIEMYDGQSINIKCADGVIAKVVCEADEIQQGSIYELVGLAKDDGTLQLFTTRELSVDMDLELYNRMITEVQHNPKFSDYFAPIQV